MRQLCRKEWLKASIITPSMPIPAPGSSYAMERESHFQPLPGPRSSICDAMFQEKREGCRGWSKIRGMDFCLATRSIQVCICSWRPHFGYPGQGWPGPAGDGGPLPVGPAISLSPVTLKKVSHGVGYPLCLSFNTLNRRWLKVGSFSVVVDQIGTSMKGQSLKETIKPRLQSCTSHH